MATGKAIIYKGIPYFSGEKITVPTRVSQLANDAGYLTTDEKVKQSPSNSTDAEYRILFSNTADDTERTEKVQKNSDFSFNPSTDTLKIGSTFSISGVYGTRDTSINVRGIKISEYVGDSLYGRLELQYRDIFLDSKWDGTNTSLKSSITTLKQHLSDYIKIKSIAVLKADAARNMSLSPYVSLDSGYKFLCWLVSGVSNGWVTSMPIYVSAPGDVRGFPFWHPNLTINGVINFYYLEIKNV